MILWHTAVFPVSDMSKGETITASINTKACNFILELKQFLPYTNIHVCETNTSEYFPLLIFRKIIFSGKKVSNYEE